MKKTVLSTMLLLLLSLVFSSSVFAEGKDIYSQCLDEAGTINNGVVADCSSKASEAYKKQINKNYNIIYKALLARNPEDAEAFERSQKSWLIYRNNYCELAGSYVGSPMYSYCPMKINKTRSEELSEMASSF